MDYILNVHSMKTIVGMSCKGLSIMCLANLVYAKHEKHMKRLFKILMTNLTMC
jgi:hypothetical protein